MSYQHCTRFRTTLDFDREYLRNGSSNRQAENNVINYNFFHVWWKQLGELWPTNEKMTLTLKFNRVCGVVDVHVHAKYHQSKWTGSGVIVQTTFLPCHNGEKSEHPVLWPWNSTGFVQLWRNMFVQNIIELSKCSASWVIVRHRKKNSDGNNTVRRYRTDSNNNVHPQLYADQRYCIVITYAVHDTSRQGIDIIGPFFRTVQQSHFLDFYQILYKPPQHAPDTPLAPLTPLAIYINLLH